MSAELSLTGIHPRSEATVRVSRDYDRGRATEQELSVTFRQDSRALQRLQLDCGFRFISDGQLRWQDFIRPFSESVSGLKGGADLSRWYDTNTFYRRPSIESIMDNATGVPIHRYCEDNEVEDSGRKISLPGPYTLASLVDDHHYGSRLKVMQSFAHILRETLRDLSAKGFSVFQINEPSLVYRYGESAVTNENHLTEFIDVFSDCVNGLKSEIWLHTYFGDCSKIIRRLIDLKGVSAIGVDFTQTSLADLTGSNFQGKTLCCGCVDGRNSLLEEPSWIANFCRQAAKAVGCESTVIVPSCDLKFLPRESADAKLRSMSAAKVILDSSKD